MIFNLENRTLSFYKNGGEIKIAYEDIDVSSECGMAISIFTSAANEFATLADFECSLL